MWLEPYFSDSSPKSNIMTNPNALPPIYTQPVPTQKVAKGIWVANPNQELISGDSGDEYFRTSGLFARPMRKKAPKSSR